MNRAALPNCWSYVKLRDCCDIVSGATPRRDHPEYWDGDIPWVTPKDLSDLEMSVLEDAPEYITEQGYKSCSTTLLPKGSILFSSRAPIGLVAIAGRPMCTNQGFKSLIPGNDVDSGYLYHCMKSLVPRIQDMGRGATFAEISKELFGVIEIPLPKEIKEQKRIAAILDNADAIRRKRQQAIQLTDEFLRSVFLDMFGDPVLNQKCWDKHQLGKLTIHGPDNGIFRKNEEYGTGLPVVWVEQLYKGDVLDVESSRRLEPTERELKKFSLRKGDIVFCRSSLKEEGIGYNNIYDGEDEGALFECHMIRVRLNVAAANPFFVNYQLRMPNMRRHVIAQSKTVTMTTIDQDGISRIEIIVPPKNKQDQFEQIHRNVLTLRRGYNEFSGCAEDNFRAIAQQAFTGVL